MEEVYTESRKRGIAIVCGHAIQEAMEHDDIKTTMIYVSLGSSIRIQIPSPPLGSSGKLTPFPKAIYELVDNRDWAREPVMDPYSSGVKQLKQAAAHSGKLLMPIPLQAAVGYAIGDKSGVQSIPGAAGLGAVSKGPSKFALVQKAKSALKRGDTEVMQEAVKDAQHEGQMLNLKRLMRSEVLGEMKKERKARQSPYPNLYKLTH